MNPPQVIRERVSTVVIHNDQILGFNAEDPYSKEKYFFLPGGKIEKDESLIEAAKRETLEETGYKISIIENFLITKKYPFTWNGITYNCTTHFYGALLLDEKPDLVCDADYHKGVSWLELKNLDKTLEYSQDILEAVKTILSQMRMTA